MGEWSPNKTEAHACPVSSPPRKRTSAASTCSEEAKLDSLTHLPPLTFLTNGSHSPSSSHPRLQLSQGASARLSNTTQDVSPSLPLSFSPPAASAHPSVLPYVFPPSSSCFYASVPLSPSLSRTVLPPSLHLSPSTLHPHAVKFPSLPPTSPGLSKA